MKRHRTLSLLAIIIVLVTLAAPIGMAGAAPAKAEPSPSEKTALVQVFATTPDDLARFEQTGLPAYTRLEGREGSYLLTGATPADLKALAAAGLSTRVLDPDMTGAAYYLVYPAPDRPRPEWGAYGRLLLDDVEEALLRTTPQDAERLSLAGAELRLLTLDPKPLRPTTAPEAFPAVIQPDPLIQEIIDQVDGDTVYYYDRQLAGEVPVWVDGAWYTIGTRHTNSGTPIHKVIRWAGQQMANLGLDVEYHVWDHSWNANVIGELPGLTNPDDIFIIGGHVDDVTGTRGADDNASGSVATLIAADILSQYQWGCTLRFALWTGEEQGLLGSAAYAHRSYQLGEHIVGYLDPDMIAWNTIGSSPGIDLRYKASMPLTLQLAQLFVDVVSAYGLALVPQLVNSSGGFSDHSSFWDHGYTAIMAFEDGNDFNPYYHGSGDTPAHLDRTYFTNYVEALIGTFAHMSGCLIPSGLDGHVTAASGSAPIEGATVTAQAATGIVFVDTTDATGYYTQTLLSGTYTVTAEAYGYLPATVAGVEIVAGAVTTQDFALGTAPHYSVSGHVTELGTGLPLLAKLQFEGSPMTVWTDPADGYYETSLMPGSYTIKVQADQHISQKRPIVVTDGDQVQDFSLEPYACTLVVDDDAGLAYQTYYASALAAAGQDYDLWTVATAGSPSAADLSNYDQVVWLTGDDYETTLTTADQAVLTSYLNGGGKLFISGQDIGYDIGTTPFYGNYLHAVYDSDDTNNYSLTGSGYLSGMGLYIAGGDGAGNQAWPSDISPTGGAVAVLDYPSPHLYGGVTYQNGTYSVVYFSFGFEAIDNQAERVEVMLRTLDWLGGCACEAVHDANFSWQPANPGAGEPVRLEGTAAGEEPIGFAWDFGDGMTGHGAVVTHTYAVSDTYAAVLTATNDCGMEVVIHDVVVRRPVVKSYFYLPIVLKTCHLVKIEGVTTSNDSLTVTFASTVSGQEPVGYLWSFGDGITSTLADPVHVYPAQGTYTATLEVSNCNGVGSDGWTGVLVLVPEIGVDPLSLEAALYPDEVTTVTLWLTNDGTVDLSFVLHETGTLGHAQAAPTGEKTRVWDGPTDDADQIASSSARDPSPCTGLIKPEVAAPGVNVRSSYNDGDYITASGTSWSAAHLAGMAALVLSADPMLSIDQVMANIEGTALCIDDSSCGGGPCPDPNNTYGYGRIDAFGAVSLTVGGMLLDLPWLAETPAAGVVSPGQAISVAVTFDAGGLEPGVYTGLLGVESDDPETPHIGVPVTLTVDPPRVCHEVDILAVTYEKVGCQVTFSAQVTGTEPMSLTWDFGAFGTSTHLAPTIDFGIDGTYPYTLTVTNCEGLFTGVVTGTVAVQCCEPVYGAGFTWMPLEPMIGQVVTFTATASGTAPIEFDWVFGDGTAGHGAVVTHTYATSDTYTVVLTATNGCGAEVVAHDVVVFPPRYHILQPKDYTYLPIVLKGL
jgi:PKD repeat protein